MTTSSCYQRIHNDMLTEYQREFAKHGNSVIHYRMIRDHPSCMDDLVAVFMQTSDQMVLWKEETVCITTLGYVDPKRSSLALSITGHEFMLHGPSDYAVAQVAFFLLTLENQDTQTCICIISTRHRFDFDVFTEEQIASLLVNDASRELYLSGLTISPKMAIVLASQRQRSRLTLCHSSFRDGGAALLDTLEKRSTTFGHLGLKGRILLEPDVQRRLLQIEALDILEVCHGCIGMDKNYFLPFTSKAREVWFELKASGDRWKSIESVTIVPKKFVLTVTQDNRGFASVFLKALKNMTEFGVLFKTRPTKRTFLDVIAAVERNKTLKVLELGKINKLWSPVWKQLMQVLAHHQGLCMLRLHLNPGSPRAMVTDLIKMLEKNRKITEVEFEDEQEVDEWTCQLEETLRFNRFFQGSKTLNQEAKGLDTALLGTALMNRSSNDAKCTAVLLRDNVDVLSMLLETASANSNSVVVANRSDVSFPTVTTEEGSKSAVEEDPIRTRKRKRFDSTNEVDVELINSSIQKAVEEALAKQNDTVQALVRQNRDLTEEMRKISQDLAHAKTDISNLTEDVRQFVDSFPAQVQADSQDRAQYTDRQMANLKSEISRLKERYVDFIIDSSTRASERPPHI